jgi:molecular chaperone GrpE
MAKTDDTKVPESKTEDPASKQPEKTANEEKIIQLEAELATCEDRWKRALADYQNLEKRTQEQKREFVQYAIKQFVDKILSVLDDLEKAQAHLKDTGLELALKKLQGVLKQEGIEKIATKDKPYAIETMEAISIVNGEKDNQVVAELRSGYTMHGAVLRPAQVTVSKKKEGK